MCAALTAIVRFLPDHGVARDGALPQARLGVALGAGPWGGVRAVRRPWWGGPFVAAGPSAAAPGPQVAPARYAFQCEQIKYNATQNDV
eukprot:scaffold1514_cov16-Prasinocladus_malaysianus.AAC.2